MDVQRAPDDPKQAARNEVSKPSQIIKHFWELFEINGTAVSLTLVTMRKSFLLCVNNYKPGELTGQQEASQLRIGVIRDEILRGFMGTNENLRGLSIAIGELNTCIVSSENSLHSATLASKLSKKLNYNRPVYVAYNVQLPHDTDDGIGSGAKLYLKIFQFVKAHYTGLPL